MCKYIIVRNIYYKYISFLRIIPLILSLFPSFSYDFYFFLFIICVEIICAEQLSVVHLTSHSAVLQWHPVLSSDGGYYELRYKAVGEGHPEKSRVFPSTSSQAELTRLQPDTMYTASLRPESNQILFRTLSVKFTTLPVRKGFSLLIYVCFLILSNHMRT